MDFMSIYIFTIPVFVAIFVVVTLKLGIRFVPQNTTFVVERFGRYSRTLTAGMNFIIPYLDSVAYTRSLKEKAFDVPSQSAITKDNITLVIDGVLYFRVIDAFRSCYGIEDFNFAIIQLAQTTMRSEIGKIPLDKSFEERDVLNAHIVEAINKASEPWGVSVLRYEIKDIRPPATVMEAMEVQMKAEREKRAVILDAQGKQEAAMAIAEGEKQAQILAAEASKTEAILNAEGAAKAIMIEAQARAKAIEVVGEQASTEEGMHAVNLELAKDAIKAKSKIAGESSVVIVPESAYDPTTLVASGVSVFEKLKKNSEEALP